jgi:hypothetical protein
VPAGDPYADIALPIPTNRNRRQAPSAPAPQDGEDAPFQPELLPGDNGIYPDTGPGSSPNNPIDLATVDRATAAGMKRGVWVKGPDGTVYPLPSDPVEGQFRVGDLPQAPGVNVRPQSVFEDVAKSLPTGVVEGLTGILGMPGTVQQMMGGEAGQMLPGFGFVGPSGQQLNQLVREGLGREYYQPQTPLGEFARTFGENLPGGLAPGGALTRFASVAVPAFASEGAAQIAEGMGASPTAQTMARTIAGLGGGLAVGGVNAVRGGADISLRNAAQGVTPQQLQMAAALKDRAQAAGINLTMANAIQHVTGGATGLGQLQRAVEGGSPLLQRYFAELPEQTRNAINAQLEQIGPLVEPGELAGQAQNAAENVLTRMRQRVNESAEPLYAQLPGQTLDPADLARLQADASYRAASAQLMGNEELAPLVTGGPEDLSTVNRVIQQLDTMGEQARPGVMNPTGNYTLAAQREQAAALARQLAGATSPEFAAARQTVATGRQAFVDPLRRGPIGTIAGQSDVQPNLAAQTEALFPSMPFEGQAAETARALELMGEIDPSVGGPLVRQQLARQAMEAQQNLATGANQFGGANFAARAFGNPEQRRTVMGALDVVNRPDPNMAFPPINANAVPPRGSDPMANLVEILMATGQRHQGGSQTAFIQDLQRQMRGGDAVQESWASLLNPMRIPGRVAGAVDELTAQANKDTLANLLMGSSEDFNARLTRALNRPRGANRVRAGVAVTAGQED